MTNPTAPSRPLACALLVALLLAAPALAGPPQAGLRMPGAGSHPEAGRLPATAAPQVPPGLTPTCYAGPEASRPAGAEAPCPVLLWRGLTFWPMGHLDDRHALTIVAFDGQGRVVGSWERAGARHAWGVGVDEVTRTVAFWGQDTRAVLMRWDELAAAEPLPAAPATAALHRASFETPTQPAAGALR